MDMENQVRELAASVGADMKMLEYKMSVDKAEMEQKWAAALDALHQSLLGEIAALRPVENAEEVGTGVSFADTYREARGVPVPEE